MGKRRRQADERRKTDEDRLQCNVWKHRNRYYDPTDDRRIRTAGIDFQAEYVDWPTLQSKSQNGTFDMLFMAWGLTADPDLTGTFASPEAGGSQNHTGYANPELEQDARRGTGLLLRKKSRKKNTKKFTN